MDCASKSCRTRGVNSNCGVTGRAYYEAANGTKIYNQGQRELRGVSKGGELLNVTVQVGDVTRMLGSVRRINQAGNRVVFDELDPEGSYVENKVTKKRTPIELRDGEFKLDMWIPKPKAINAVTEQWYTTFHRLGQ